MVCFSGSAKESPVSYLVTQGLTRPSFRSSQELLCSLDVFEKVTPSKIQAGIKNPFGPMTFENGVIIRSERHVRSKKSEMDPATYRRSFRLNRTKPFRHICATVGVAKSRGPTQDAESVLLKDSSKNLETRRLESMCIKGDKWFGSGADKGGFPNC
jgi:hypothetical protein